jgi:ferrochelatase
MNPGRTAVVLFNLGGPDAPESVEPFLFNLFNDPAIIGLPHPFRWLVAKLVSVRRAPVAGEIYGQIGGGSPLLPNTRAQARALDAALGPAFKSFVAMRYWHPRASETVRDVLAWKPDRVVLLPLYPQFSTTTTASSVKEWERTARRAGLRAPSRLICCYPEEAGFIRSAAERVREGLDRFRDSAEPVRVLFSAHGLPERIVARGDPYQWQVERSVAAIVDELRLPELDYRLCFQSRVGPLKWIGPALDQEVRRAGQERISLLVVPVSFVSEHSETLVELDIELRHLAVASGVRRYERAGTVDTASGFVAGLATLVREAVEGRGSNRICSADRKCCLWAPA